MRPGIFVSLLDEAQVNYKERYVEPKSSNKNGVSIPMEKTLPG